MFLDGALSSQTTLTELESVTRASSPLPALSIPSQLARFVSSWASIAVTASSLERSALMAATTKPLLPIRAWEDWEMEPDSATVRLTSSARES